MYIYFPLECFYVELQHFTFKLFELSVYEIRPKGSGRNNFGLTCNKSKVFILHPKSHKLFLSWPSIKLRQIKIQNG